MKDPHSLLGDVSEYTLSGEALRASEARYRRLFETAQDGILILDATTGAILDANPFLLHLLDYTPEDINGKALWDIGLFKDIEASKTAFRELQANGYVRYEDLPLKTRSGRSINVEFVSNVYGENRAKVIQCNIRDITRRKYSEQSEQRLRQAQKMEAVGQLAGGIAHDFNNVLGVILGYCELLEKRADLAVATRNMIGEIHDAGACAKDLTRHLLAFSRRQVFQPVFSDLNTTVLRFAKMLRRLIGADTELVCALSRTGGTVKTDSSQIEQVLMNLVINARDAMPRGGTITITSRNVEIDDTNAQQYPLVKTGCYVVLTVSDTGIGMDKETQSRLFEPFFSTKAVGKGTGLGLSTVCGIVKQCSGMICVESAPGHGSTFTIFFPRFEDPPAVMEADTLTALRGGSETILLVEDTAPLRGLMRLLLEESGYTVIESGDPEEALVLAAQHQGPLPLLITDVIMPGLSGFILAERLAAARPETRVLYTSGFADDTVIQRGVYQPDFAFLEKPFTRNSLIRKVREVLDFPASAAV